MPPEKSKARTLLLCAVLVVAAFAAYGDVTSHEFLNYDDFTYVTSNPKVLGGLSLEGVKWAFTTNHEATWHPLTWLSHMLDCQLFGRNAGRHHLVNLLFHIANTLMLFFVVRRMTGRFWESGLVAALFALHPLHVESVAWIAERKDVLSALFWLLTMWGYCRYVEGGRKTDYLLTLLFFALGLMAKPMLVTLPFVLLLLDFWPFRRFPSRSGEGGPGIMTAALRLVREKIPFIVLAAGACVVTVVYQRQSGAMGSLEILPFGERMANALVSMIGYLVKTVWPSRLAVMYPHPGMPPVWQIAGSSVLIAILFLLAFLAARKCPWLTVGWLWFAGTLVPVIGLVQVGVQGMADRYTYIPHIGLFIAVVFGCAHLAQVYRKMNGPAVLGAAAVAVLLALGITTRSQVKHWADSITLFMHSVSVTENNWVAHYNLGMALAGKGRNAEAAHHYREALRIKDEQPSVHNNLGHLLDTMGKPEEAILHYRKAIEINPNHLSAYNNLGVALYKQGKVDEAIFYFEKALEINPDYVDAWRNLKIVRSQRNMSPNTNR